jgi:hypothetical protein
MQLGLEASLNTWSSLCNSRSPGAIFALPRLRHVRTAQSADRRARERIAGCGGGRCGSGLQRLVGDIEGEEFFVSLLGDSVAVHSLCSFNSSPLTAF